MPHLRPSCLVPLLALEDCLSSQAGQSGTHSRLRTRDLGAAGNTVFGVIIAVGFASLILICGVTSRAYRRVARQEQYIVITDDQQTAISTDEYRESPMLWDLWVDENAKERVSEWDDEVVSTHHTACPRFELNCGYIAGIGEARAEPICRQ